MSRPFQRFFERVNEIDVVGRMLEQIPEPHRQTLSNLRTQLREQRRESRFEFIRRHPVGENQQVRGAAMVIGAVYDGGRVLGVNVLRGDVAGSVRAVNVMIGDVRGGEVRSANLIVGDVHEGRLRSVNVMIGDVRGGEVQCNILIGDVYDGRVTAEIMVGHEHGGAVDARERVHIHDGCPE